MDRTVFLVLIVLGACAIITILYAALVVTDDRWDFVDDMADRLKEGDTIECQDIQEMIYLCADLELTYSPGNDENAVGDQKLYEFVRGLTEVVRNW